jgi:serine/threonine-protein kinase
MAEETTQDSDDAGDAGDASELTAGTEVGGYVIEGKIGQGGMGVVYGAHQPRIGKRVAIKVLSPQYSANPSTVRRFEQEARLVNKIKHPNIVDVFQFGELPDGRSYFVMEWLEGEPLSARIERGPIPAREAIALLDLICDALEAAHEQGVVHRDLKSDNVFIVKAGRQRSVKLLDFGLAKLAGKQDVASVNRTRSGVIVGTPAYMAPEQARGKAIDARTDIYALGVLAYKMLTGAMPFKADNAMDLIVLHLNAPPPAPNKLARDTPPDLSRLIVRMMAKDPTQRPSLTEIRKLFSGIRGTTQETPVVAPPRRATSFLAGVAISLVGVIAFGAYWLTQREGASDAPSTQTSSAALTPAPGSAVAPAAGSAVTPPAPTPPPIAAPVAPEPPEPLAGSADAISGADGSAAPAAPTIEFEPDPIARGSTAGSDAQPARRRADQVTDAGPAPEPLPVVKPGSLILVLETASSIEIDGTAVSQSSRGGRFEVSPGQHEIRVKAPGRQAVVRTFEVEAGGTAVIRIADDSETPEPAPSPAP